jgi:hypothetical protein
MDEDNFEDMDGTLFDGISDLDQIEKEDALLYMAFNNSYDIITHRVTFDELLEINHSSPDGFTALAHNIETGPTDEDIDNMILYFQELEEYEKCAILHKMVS